MDILHSPITYNEDGSVKQILDDIWVKGCDSNHLRIPVMLKFEGWAYVESSADVPTPVQVIEYVRTNYFSKGWQSYTRVS